MRYVAYEKLSFETLGAFRANPTILLDHVLTTLRSRLRDEAVGTYNADTMIRPFPRSERENSEHGYEQAQRRQGLEIVMVVET